MKKTLGLGLRATTLLKVVVLGVLLSTHISTFATIVPVQPALKASEIFLAVGKTGQLISLMELSKISSKDLQRLTGKKDAPGRPHRF